MPPLTALRKHPCPACGGDAEWNAAKQALACPFCGTLVPWSEGDSTLDSAIVEHDLEQALAESATTHPGAQTQKQSVKCESCQAISVFDAERVAQRCDFCGSPAIVPFDDLNDTIIPESLLPTVVAATQVRDQLRSWYASRWFAPDKLKRSALTDTLQGVYLPYWTFDAKVDATWTAQSGYHYCVTEAVRDSEGRTQTRQVQKTRWEDSSGQLSHFFDDELVPGTVGVHLKLLRKVEPFPTTSELKPYDPAYVRGWTVERYQVDLQQASATSRAQMDATVYQLCGRQVPGDTHRNLQVASDYQARSFKHILVPIWLVSYTYGAKSFQVVVNGYTGKIAGEHPLSWIKIALAVIAALVIILVLVALSNR
jgi:hypothetical protein